MLSYAILLALAFMVNANNPRMLALTAVVGAGIFAPVPDANFYLICALGELLIGLVAMYIATNASMMIWRVSMLLLAFHFAGFLFNGYPPDSPYRILVKLAEHFELLSLIVLSNIFMKWPRHDS